MFNILSLDGGGIRGLMTTIILERLNKAAPGWLDDVDLIAGTSTGGIIALCLARGVDASIIRQFYQEKGKDIFHDTVWDNVKDLGNLAGAEYGNTALEKELRGLLGEKTTLGDLQKGVLITSFRLDNGAAEGRTWKPKVFHNFEGDDSDGEHLAWHVGMFTSAAPTYFPTFGGYVDGGVFANNPAMCALAQSQDIRAVGEQPPALADIRILSIGTGAALQYIEGEALNWGLVKWARPLVNLIMDGVAGVADYQCRHLLGENYQRVQPNFPAGQPIGLADVKKISAMVELATNGVQLDETVAWLKSKWAVSTPAV